MRSGFVKINNINRAIWPHEISAAMALAKNGYEIEFVLPSNYHKTADILVNNKMFEIKSPEKSSVRSIDHILQKGAKQSDRIILDVLRLKNLSTTSMVRYLTSWVKTNRVGVKEVILITKDRHCIDIRR